jgi:hypothetical protein
MTVVSEKSDSTLSGNYFFIGEPVYGFLQIQSLRTSANASLVKQKHWHGAMATIGMTHIAIQENPKSKVVEWMEKFSCEQYSSVSFFKFINHVVLQTKNSFVHLRTECAYLFN